MNISGPFVLKHDILLIPCTELSEDVRRRITFEEGDFTLSHRHGRTLAQIIDGETAALLGLFREPRTIVDAVIENSRALGKEPRAWLDELLPHFDEFVQRRVLVPAGSEDEKEMKPQYDSGATIGSWTVVRCVSLVEDTEIYQLNRGSDMAALKIGRFTAPALRALFDNEAAVLRHLDGSGIVPRLLDAGLLEERPYLIMEWVAGLDAGVAAAQRRHDRAALLDLCSSIAEAYVALHARGVLHVDVHARNVMVGQKVTLLDFGYSRLAGRTRDVPRAGMYYFYEPELVAAWREGRSIPPTAAGEQYSVAALLYLMITGQYYLDFRFEQDEMSRQVEEDPPLPFAQRGVPPWPEVEQILFPALEKDPGRRHESIVAMAALLAGARDAIVRDSIAAPVSAEAAALLETTLQAFARGGSMFARGFPVPPTAGVNFGAAGAAVGLLRIAETRGDPALLALADVWRSRTAALIGTRGAWYQEPGLRPDNLGTITPYHTESGVHAAAAMIAAAMGDAISQRRAVAAYLRACDRPCAELDLTLGRSGCLLVAALLLEISDDVPEAAASLRAFGAETMRAVWRELDTHTAIPDTPPKTYLGMAHGWSGYLYAALRWCAASGDALPPRLTERLHEFAALKMTSGRGVWWRRLNDPRRSEPVIPAWCNGTAGHVFLFTLAHRLLRDQQWLQLAEQTAWTTWEVPSRLANLCCGSVGRAYALLNLYKHTGDSRWLNRARRLTNVAAASAEATTQRRNSLWRGELGVAVLVADMESPENAKLPFFE